MGLLFFIFEVKLIHMKNILLTACFIVFVFSRAFSQGSSNINLLYHWDDSTLPGSSFYNNTYNEIWGFVQNNKEIAVIGSTMGTHFFDVTDPVNSIQVDFVPGGAQGTNIVHRDYHDYNGYLYAVADEGSNSSLQIIDLQYLPDSVHVVYDSNVLIKRAHNIFIDTATAKMYVGGGFTTTGNNLSIYSLSNPIQPVFLKSYNSAGYVHDMYVRNDTAFLNAGFVSGSTGGLHIVDFSDVQNPVTLNTLTNYPFSGYNHSGWLNEQGNIYVMADETHGMPLKIIDVSDFSNLQVLSTITSGVTTNSIPHNVIIKENYAFVSYYYDGLYVFDISDPANPVIAGFYDTSTEPNNNSYKGAWGVYPYLPSGNVLVSDMQNGLYIFDVTGAVTSAGEINSGYSGVLLFPNPVKNKLNILLPPGKTKPVTVKLLNLQGQIILDEFIYTGSGAIEFNVENISPGIYFVNTITDDVNATIKLVIK